MTMALTLLFIAFGVPVLTTVLASGYELSTHYLKPTMKPHIPDGFYQPVHSKAV